MIDMEMWFVWCRGVLFGLIASVIIREFGEWVRSRQKKHEADLSNICGECYWAGGQHSRYCSKHQNSEIH